MPKVRPLHFPVFLTGVLLTIAFVAYAAWSSADHRRTDALHTAEVYSARLETLMGGLFHKTDVLESVIIAGHGHIPETAFEDLARSLADGTGIRAVQYLPDSIVLSGPYSLFQGGLGLVARNPIFLTEADGREKFWGFAALILDLPEALKPVFLDALRQEGYAYRLHCRGEHGDDLTIAQSGVMPSGRPVDYGIQVPNHAWTLSLAPEGGWVDTRELPLQLGLGFVISGLCAVVAHQRREKERLLRQAAETDDLTGLYNRRKLNRVVDALCRAPQPAHFVFLYMDLNAFKACNDTLGHFWGDTVLKEFARRLRSALGPQAALARVGGDEFAAVVVTGGGRDAVPELLRRIRESLREPVLLDGMPAGISSSTGWAEFPAEGKNYDALMKTADARMYEDKRRHGAERACGSAQA